MTTIRILGEGFAFEATFEHLPAGNAQRVAFEAMSTLHHADFLLSKEQTAKFTVILRGYADGKKINMIKEIRAATGLGLKEAKDLSEALPAAVLSGIGRKDAVALVERLKAEGGQVDLVDAA